MDSDRTATATQLPPLHLPSLYPPGTVVDRYVILHPLGAGGMGAVYAAYDSELDRRVALKFLLPRVGDGDDASASQGRLLLEARAMARLSHPNVVTLYQVGPAPAGGIYLAMELVEGGTLQDWLLEKKRGWREVLGLLCEAGEGLAAAHAAGMIHRDFKLENVLVRRDGRPQVTDFGVVRAAGDEPLRDDRSQTRAPTTTLPGASSGGPEDSSSHPLSTTSLSQLTLTGAMLGTPGYMAPEQYEQSEQGGIDARADVFAFCATLYRALYGQRPFEGSGLTQVVDATLLGRVREPPPESDVPRWLRKVVLWGLAPERADRPASMRVLLAALRADPAKARRRWLVGGVLGLVVAVTAFAVHSVGARRVRGCQQVADRLGGVWDAGRKATIASAFRASGRGYAGETWTRVEQRLDAYAASWTAASYEACAATRVRGEQSAEMMTLRADCLDQRLDELSAVSALFANADGKMVENAVKLAGALTPLEPCGNLDRLSAGARLPFDPKARAEVRELQAKVTEAQDLRMAGQENPSLEKLRALEARVNATGYGPLLVAWTKAAASANEVREPKLSIELWRSAVSLADTYHLDQERAASEVGLARMSDLLGQHADASVWFTMAGGTLARIGGDPLVELRRDTGLGTNYYDQGKYPEAERALERAIARAAENHVNDPTYVANAHSLLAFTLGNDESRVAEAIAHARTAVAIDEEAFGRDHPYVDTMLNNLGEIEISAGQYDDALAAIGRSVANLEGAIARGELPPDHAQLASALSAEASALTRLGRTSEAIPLLERARGIDRAHGTKEWLLFDDYELAEALRREGRIAEAAGACAEGRALADESKEMNPGFLVALGVVEAEVALDRGKPEEALVHAERAMALAQGGTADTFDLSRTRLVLARALLSLGRDTEKARALVEQARVGFAKIHDARKVEEASKVGAGTAGR